MHLSLLKLLRCPVTRTPLRIEVISRTTKNFNGIAEEIIDEGILFAEVDWFYPVIKGIPRLNVEAFIDHQGFLQKHLSDYKERKKILNEKYSGLIKYVVRKNAHTKQSFSKEWSIFNYQSDKTWSEDRDGMLKRFLREIDEHQMDLAGKIIFDAGCGNGLLNQMIARNGAVILGMDFSFSIERAFENNDQTNAFFIQGDVQFPPVAFEYFDIVHSSGVLHHTNNTELSFSCIEPCVKTGGKLSVWLYHPRKDLIHNLFNFTRRFTSKLPVNVQYYLYRFTIFPISYVMHKMKGNKYNSRELMIGILDWLSPEFRWEHEESEAATWFSKRRYELIKVTTSDVFGFNITGNKMHENEGRHL
jgi:2-polyprenyl-3-methyl-5-hydroxy-6-metoxy-1,4-benzoquinol methylase